MSSSLFTIFSGTLPVLTPDQFPPQHSAPDLGINISSEQYLSNHFVIRRICCSHKPLIIPDTFRQPPLPPPPPPHAADITKTVKSGAKSGQKKGAEQRRGSVVSQPPVLSAQGQVYVVPQDPAPPIIDTKMTRPGSRKMSGQRQASVVSQPLDPSRPDVKVAKSEARKSSGPRQASVMSQAAPDLPHLDGVDKIGPRKGSGHRRDSGVLHQASAQVAGPGGQIYSALGSTGSGSAGTSPVPSLSSGYLSIYSTEPGDQDRELRDPRDYVHRNSDLFRHPGFNISGGRPVRRGELVNHQITDSVHNHIF